MAERRSERYATAQEARARAAVLRAQGFDVLMQPLTYSGGLEGATELLIAARRPELVCDVEDLDVDARDA